MVHKVRNIVLIGFMGTGKTTIATKVALKLGMKYVSTDGLIEESEKRTINEIFTEKGEDYFRGVESEVIRKVSGMENAVVDAGGGAVLREENMANLKASGTVICLTADEATIFERVKKYKHRPLLNVKEPKMKIRELLAKRSPFYAKADHTIDTGKLTVRQAVNEILKIVTRNQ
jgi:shikimate kinase